MKILGIAGPKRSGKDTAADFLAYLIPMIYGLKVHRAALATPIKEMCPQEPGESKEEWRLRLQALGKKLVEERGSDWAVDWAVKHAPACGMMIISDVRRHAEARRIDALGGKVIGIYTPLDLRQKWSGTPCDDTDATEVEAMELVLNNQWTLTNSSSFHRFFGEIIYKMYAHEVEWGLVS